MKDVVGAKGTVAVMWGGIWQNRKGIIINEVLK